MLFHLYYFFVFIAETTNIQNKKAFVKSFINYMNDIS